MISMKLKKIIGVVFYLFFALNLQAQRGGIKIGYIDMDFILENVPEYQQSLNQLNSKAEKWSGEIAKKKAAIDQLKEELENERPLLTIELIEEKEEEIGYLTNEMFKYQEQKFGVGGDFLTQKRQLIQPMQDQIFNAIQEIGENRKFDLIFENSSEALLLYSNRRHDLSDIVLKLIKREIKQNPLKSEEEADEMFGGEYLSVQDAEAKEKQVAEKEAAQKAKEDERERLQDERLSEREKQRAERQKAFEERRAKILKEREEQQRKRDSIREARNN